MKFIKYDGRLFCVGMKFRLGGRHGAIKILKNDSGSYTNVHFFGEGSELIWLEKYPDLEIGIEEPTISEQLEIDLLVWANLCPEINGIAYHALVKKLASMVKKD